MKFLYYLSLALVGAKEFTTCQETLTFIPVMLLGETVLSGVGPVLGAGEVIVTNEAPVHMKTIEGEKKRFYRLNQNVFIEANALKCDG